MCNVREMKRRTVTPCNFKLKEKLHKLAMQLVVPIKCILPPFDSAGQAYRRRIKEGLLLLRSSLKSFDYHQANSDNQALRLDKFDQRYHHKTYKIEPGDFKKLV